MPYFPLTTLQEMALALFLGLGTLVLLYVAWAYYPAGPAEPGAEEAPKPEEAGSGAGPRKADRPLPPLLIVVYVGVIAWVLAYLVLVGLRVKAIG
jgi:hypothetical protein